MATKRSYEVRDIQFGDPMSTYAGYADAVVVNQEGEWLAEIDYIFTDTENVKIAMPYTDPDGDFIPAPDNWRDKIISEL